MIPPDFSYDESLDIVTIWGVRYSGELLRQFAFAEVGTWIRIVDRVGNQPILGTVHPTLQRQIDELVARFH